MNAREKAKREAFIEDYLKLCSEYGLAIDCLDDMDVLGIVSTVANEDNPGWNMKMFTEYMRNLV